MDNSYQLVPFYEALADKLLAYNDKRDELFALIKRVSFIDLTNADISIVNLISLF